MNRGLFAVLIGALAIAGAGAGCGGSDDSSTTVLTKAEFVRQANAICKQAEEEKLSAFAAASKEIEPGAKLSVAEREELLIPISIPPMRKMVARLGELSAPDGEEEQVEAIVVAYEKGVDQSKSDPAAVISGDAFVKASGLARGYGLTSC